jgi:hypothetical protein
MDCLHIRENQMMPSGSYAILFEVFELTLHHKVFEDNKLKSVDVMKPLQTCKQFVLDKAVSDLSH